MSEERDPNLNEEEDIRMDETMDKHWRDFSDDGDYNKNIHILKWDF